MADEKKGILWFKEETGRFTGSDMGKGEPIDCSRVILDMWIDDKKIGYIDRDGSVVFCGYVIEDVPTEIMHWEVALTPAQRKEIDREADKFQEKCVEQAEEPIFQDALEKCDSLARKIFPESGTFGHLVIVEMSDLCVFIAGGQGESKIYAPGVYVYEAGIAPDSEVEYRVEKIGDLNKELRTEFIKAAMSMATLEG